MSELQFDNQNNEFGRPPEESSGFDLSGMLISWGIVNNRKEAEYVLMALAVVALLVAAYFFFSSSSSTPPPPPVGV